MWTSADSVMVRRFGSGQVQWAPEQHGYEEPAGRAFPPRPHREEWRSALALSLPIMVVFPFALIAGVMLVGPGQAAILNYTMPLWASLLAVPVLGERLDRRTPMALGLGLAAVLLVLAGTIGPEGPKGLGVALGLLAGATFGAGTVLDKKLRFRSPALLITAWQLRLGTPPASWCW
ncbi:DMT family transporter [Dankookia sp. GCM10030260]|uniref:DMT family transporter n=1 Tax=Dankookia sp. GCM10030260 TaxID=3273390 RepID=UPI00361B06E3